MAKPAPLQPRPRVRPADAASEPAQHADASHAFGAGTGLPLFLQRGPRVVIQAKRLVNDPDDPFEQEADAIAERVTQRPEPISRERSRTAAPSTIPAPATTAAITPPDGGTPLADEMRARVEPVLDADLSSVRVHDSPAARQTADALHARAFTHQNHIWLGSNERTDDPALLAHEATHVVHQSIGGESATGTPPPIQRQADGGSAGAVAAPLASATTPPPATTGPALMSKADGGSEQPPAEETLSAVDTRGKAEKTDATAADLDGHGSGAAGGQVEGGRARAGQGRGGDGEPAVIEDIGDQSRPVVPETGAGNMETGDLVLIDVELAEHQRWEGALGRVGAAGSVDRAAFIAEQAGSGFISGAASGLAMGLGIGLVTKAVPALGPIIGGGLALHGLVTRDWAETGATIGRFGEGSDTYQVLANSIASVSAIIDIVSQVLTVINGIVGIVQTAAAIIAGGAVVAAFFTFGATLGIAAVAADVVGVCEEISLGISAVTSVLDEINAAILQPCVLLFTALHEYTSQADPREVEAQGERISTAAAASGAALGAWAGGRAAHIGSGAHPPEDLPPTQRPAHETPPPAPGEGPTVHFQEPPIAPEHGGVSPTPGAAPEPIHVVAPAGPEMPAATAATHPEAPPVTAPPVIPESTAQALPHPEAITAPHGAAPEVPPAATTPHAAPSEPAAAQPLQGTVPADIDTPPPGWEAPPPGFVPEEPQLGGNWPYNEPVPNRGDVGENVQRDHVIAQAKLRDMVTDPTTGQVHYPSEVKNSLTVLAETGAATADRPALPHTEVTFHGPNADVPQIDRLRAQGGPASFTDDIVGPSRDARVAAGYDPQAVDRGWVDQLGRLHATQRIGETLGHVERLSGGQPIAPGEVEGLNWSAFDGPSPTPVASTGPAVSAPATTAMTPVSVPNAPISEAVTVPHAMVAPPAAITAQTGVPSSSPTSSSSTWQQLELPGTGTPLGPPPPRRLTPDEVTPAGTRSAYLRRLRAEAEGRIGPDGRNPDGPGRGPNNIARHQVPDRANIEGIWESTSPTPDLYQYSPRQPEGWESHHVEQQSAFVAPGGGEVIPGYNPNEDITVMMRRDPEHQATFAAQAQQRAEPDFHQRVGTAGALEEAHNIAVWGTRTAPPAGTNPPQLMDPRVAGQTVMEHSAYLFERNRLSGDIGQTEGVPPRPGETPLAQRPIVRDLLPGPAGSRVDPYENIDWDSTFNQPDPYRASQPAGTQFGLPSMEWATQRPTPTAEQLSLPHVDQPGANPNQLSFNFAAQPKATPPASSSGTPPPSAPPAPPSSPIASTVAPAVPAATASATTRAAMTGEAPTAPPATSPSVSWGTRAHQAGELFLPQIFGAGGHGPTHAEKEAAHRARFTPDNQPAEGVERVNPEYPAPPGTPAQITAIQNEIMNLLTVRATAEREAQNESQRAEQCEANRSPIRQTIADTNAGISAVQAHDAAIARREAANQEQQRRQQESQGLVSGYPSRATGLGALTVPLAAWEGFTSLASHLPGEAGDRMLRMNQEARQMQDSFAQMAAQMIGVDGQEPAQQAGLQNDQQRLDTTGEQADASGQHLQTSSEGADGLKQANDAAHAEARRREHAATDRAGQCTDAAAEREEHATSLAEQLRAWAQAHAAARQQAIANTTARLEGEGRIVVRESER